MTQNEFQLFCAIVSGCYANPGAAVAGAGGKVTPETIAASALADIDRIMAMINPPKVLPHD